MRCSQCSAALLLLHAHASQHMTAARPLRQRWRCWSPVRPAQWPRAWCSCLYWPIGYQPADLPAQCSAECCSCSSCQSEVRIDGNHWRATNPTTPALIQRAPAFRARTHRRVTFMADSHQAQAWRLHALRYAIQDRILPNLALHDLAALAATCCGLREIVAASSARVYHAAAQTSGFPRSHPVCAAGTAGATWQRIRQAFSVHAAIRDHTATPKPRQTPVLSCPARLSCLVQLSSCETPPSLRQTLLQPGACHGGRSSVQQ